jgi:hypothetical protein
MAELRTYSREHVQRLVNAAAAKASATMKAACKLVVDEAARRSQNGVLRRVGQEIAKLPDITGAQLAGDAPPARLRVVDAPTAGAASDGAAGPATQS